MRWIWIDRFTKFERGKSARAVKYLSLAEDYFEQHLPGFPIMPACFILEGLAQTGGILVGEANDFREKVVLAKITSATFEREVLPGEQLIYDVEIEHLLPEGGSVQGRVTSAGKPVANAAIFFAHLDQARSKQLFGDHNFVFSGELKHLLGLAKMVAQKPGDQSSGAAPV